MESRSKRIIQYVLLTMAALSLASFYHLVIHANQTTVALSFLVLILFTAFRQRLEYSIYLSLLCTLLYNFYFLPPIGSFSVSDPQNLVALFAFLAAGVSVNHVSAKERRQASALAKQQSEIEKLYEFSQRLMLEDHPEELSQSVPALVAQGFHLRAVALYLPDREAAVMWDPEHLLDGMESLHLATQSDAVASRSVTGIRSDIRIVPLMLGQRAIGALAMAESGYSEGFYDAIGGLTAIIIERASAIERHSRTEAAREGELLRAALLDSITHELRTPLTGIRMAATTMLNGQSLDAASHLELASIISEESIRLDRLIDEAVVMAQLGAGEVHVRRQTWEIGDVIQLAMDQLRARLRGRQLLLEIAPDMPGLPMDADLMRRVWKHLLENALQYSPPQSPIRLSAIIRQGRLCMEVENSGPGIAEEEQSLIFDRFFRGANRGLHAEGTGMGLAIVKAILEAHQGSIRVASGRDQKTAFSFWIPALLHGNEQTKNGSMDRLADTSFQPGDTTAATPAD